MHAYIIYAVSSLIGVPLLTCVLMPWFRKSVSFEGQHIFITGGSQGIGQSLAQQFVQRGANVTIVSRTQSKLDDVVRQIEGNERSFGSIQAIAADVTSFAQVIEAKNQAENKLGMIDIAICCAGAANTGRFIEQDIKFFQQSMQLIYFGSLHVAKAAIPSMLERRKGHILFMLSPLAAIGFVGYASYCPAKYALRGLADVLRNELVGTGVKLSLGYPLDTDTPGFAEENRTKPPETEAISRFSGGEVYSADKIAASLIRGLEKGEYHIKTPEVIVNLLLSSSSNITPKLYPLVIELFLAPVIVALLAIYRLILDGFVRRARKSGLS